MLRVLIVEDDAVFRRGLARMFLSEECEVAQASDGEQAIVFITAAIPDLVISDLRLPGIDGLGVLGHLQQIRPKTPFILVTAYYSEELAKEVEAQGASAVFEKPIELKQLREKCTQMLRGVGGS
jgi:CheY-like chemotaxis protein